MAEDLGDIIQGARERMGLTQTELARRSGVVQPELSRLESRTTGKPSFELIVKLSIELGLSLNDIAVKVGLMERPPPKRGRNRAAEDALHDALGAQRELSKALARIQKAILPPKR